MPQNTKEKASPMIHTPYTSHNEGLLGATMCHGPLCDLDQHCKHGFLWGRGWFHFIGLLEYSHCLATGFPQSDARKRQGRSHSVFYDPALEVTQSFLQSPNM